MSWEAIATFALSFVSLVGLNLGAIRWLLAHEETEISKRISDLKKRQSVWFSPDGCSVRFARFCHQG